ncbi:MAG: DUF423 domain-containing protein, partial [Saprospiraceae bacterium]
SLVLVACFGMIAVGLGAFGAHSLKSLIPTDQINIYQTGVTYQFYHTLAMFGIYLIYLQQPSQSLQYAFLGMLIGICLFSGSLYLLSCRSLLGIEGWKFLGPITPIGGLSFIVGWFFLLWHSIKQM